jgi:hypothetical protein
MWLAQTCRHLFCGDVIVDKLHFLTGSQKNNFYQRAAEVFSMKKRRPFLAALH